MQKITSLIKGTKLYIIAIIGAIHALLIATSSFEVRMSSDNSLGAIVNYYGFLSGSVNHYGFFAPGLVSQLKASYVLYDGEGQLLKEGLVNTGNIETSFRFHNMIENFAMEDKYKEIKRAYAASWSAKIFADHPQSEKLTLQVDSLVLPTSERYRAGDRLSWEKVYRADFFKRDVKGAES